VKIVDRKTFLSLPPGTVYAKWGDGQARDPKVHDLTYGAVAVKGDTVGCGDWVEEPLVAWPEDCSDSGQWADAMVAAIGGAETAPMAIGDSGCRDGFFDEDQLFAVFGRVEVERLIAMLQGGLETAYHTRETAGL